MFDVADARARINDALDAIGMRTYPVPVDAPNVPCAIVTLRQWAFDIDYDGSQ